MKGWIFADRNRTFDPHLEFGGGMVNDLEAIDPSPKWRRPREDWKLEV